MRQLQRWFKDVNKQDAKEVIQVRCVVTDNLSDELFALACHVQVERRGMRNVTRMVSERLIQKILQNPQTQPASVCLRRQYCQ